MAKFKPTDEEWNKAWEQLDAEARAEGEPTFDEVQASMKESLDEAPKKAAALREAMKLKLR